MQPLGMAVISHCGSRGSMGMGSGVISPLTSRTPAEAGPAYGGWGGSQLKLHTLDARVLQQQLGEADCALWGHRKPCCWLAKIDMHQPV